MITLLRKIRRSLIDTGMPRRYLLYAIGEIALVVLGILIALQINTFNDNKKIRKSEIVILKDLIEEFSVNQESLKEQIGVRTNAHEKWKELIFRIESDTLPYLHRHQLNIGVASLTFDPSESVLNSLISSGKFDRIKNDSLKYIILSWIDGLSGYRQLNNLHLQFANNIFIPYEIGLIPTPFREHNEFNEESEVYYLYQSNQEMKQMVHKAYKDVKYQNLILRNYFLIRRNLEASKALLIQFNEVISELEKEIQQKI